MRGLPDVIFIVDQAKEEIANGIICNKKHLQEVCTDGCYGDNELKQEAIRVLADDISGLFDEIIDKMNSIKDLL
jgi:hypothetical protein